jgi:hypothetical protein
MPSRRFPPRRRAKCASSASNSWLISTNRAADRRRLAQQQGALESDCLWQTCTAHKRCHISLAVNHRQRERSLFRRHCLRLSRYQRQSRRRSPYVPPLIQVQHLPERLMRCQRQRYQLLRHWPPDRGIGSRSPAERKSGNTDRHPGKTHKTCGGQAWLRTMARRDRYRRIRHTPSKKPPTTLERKIFLPPPLPPTCAPNDIAIRSGPNRGKIRITRT